MNEDEIRADERRKCMAEIEAAAVAYSERVKHLKPDRVKADAWMILQGVGVLRKGLAGPANADYVPEVQSNE